MAARPSPKTARGTQTVTRRRASADLVACASDGLAVPRGEERLQRGELAAARRVRHGCERQIDVHAACVLHIIPQRQCRHLESHVKCID